MDLQSTPLVTQNGSESAVLEKAKATEAHALGLELTTNMLALDNILSRGALRRWASLEWNQVHSQYPLVRINQKDGEQFNCEKVLTRVVQSVIEESGLRGVVVPGGAGLFLCHEDSTNVSDD